MQSIPIKSSICNRGKLLQTKLAFSCNIHIIIKYSSIWRRADIEWCQGDNIPSPELTNQEYTSRGHHKVFKNWKTHTMQQALNGPDKVTKWISHRIQNYISSSVNKLKNKRWPSHACDHRSWLRTSGINMRWDELLLLDSYSWIRAKAKLKTRLTNSKNKPEI